MNRWLTIGVSFVTDFAIGFGGCIQTAQVATGTVQMPSKAVLFFAGVTGLVAASRRIQALVTPTPQNGGAK